jgi:hypothetical protein
LNWALRRIGEVSEREGVAGWPQIEASHHFELFSGFHTIPGVIYVIPKVCSERGRDLVRLTVGEIWLITTEDSFEISCVFCLSIESIAAQSYSVLKHRLASFTVA